MLVYYCGLIVIYIMARNINTIKNRFLDFIIIVGINIILKVHCKICYFFVGKGLYFNIKS